jgi:hypothetical protein
VWNVDEAATISRSDCAETTTDYWRCECLKLSSNDLSLLVVVKPSTQFEKCLDVGLGAQVGFNYIETGVVVFGEWQLVVEMSLLTKPSYGTYSVVRMEQGLRGLEETVDPSGSTYFVSVGNVFTIKREVGGRQSYSEPFLVPNRA